MNTMYVIAKNDGTFELCLDKPKANFSPKEVDDMVKELSKAMDEHPLFNFLKEGSSKCLK